MPETVIIGGRHSDHYHTDPDCSQINHDRARTRDLADVGDREECTYCAGEFEGVGPADPFETRDLLLETDPEDAGLP